MARVALGSSSGLKDARQGHLGERVAARRLGRTGMRVAARRVATRFGELDLVLWDGSELVVCEVKSTRGERPLDERRLRPMDRVRPQDTRRLTAAAQALARSLGAASGRVDLVEVRFSTQGRAEVRHVRGLEHQEAVSRFTAEELSVEG